MVAIIAATPSLLSTAKCVSSRRQEILQFFRDLPKLFSAEVVSIATAQEPEVVVGNLLPTSQQDQSVLRLRRMSVPIPSASLPLIDSSAYSPQELRPEES